jgi:hypothetical protein
LTSSKGLKSLYPVQTAELFEPVKQAMNGNIELFEPVKQAMPLLLEMEQLD